MRCNACAHPGAGDAGPGPGHARACPAARPADVQRAEQIRLEPVAEVCEGQLLRGADVPVAGVVDDVQAAE
jgi:hypothetical protein